MIPVEEHHGLCRDAYSNSIINTDRDAYLKARMKKNAIIQQKAEYAEMKNQIAELTKRCESLESQVLQLRGINN
jgi:hypothetical protein